MRNRGASAILGLLVLSAFAVSADAKTKRFNAADSETACVNWCFDHNSTTFSRDKCLNQCECYYHGNLCAQGAGGANLNAAPLQNSLQQQ
jgi:hypothetical protein